MDYRRAMDGNIVGERARAQLGPDFIWPPSQDDPETSVAEALILLQQSPTVAAAEVPILHNGLYARADALIPEGNGYILRETKASTFALKADKATPGLPQEHHLNDLAIQSWVMMGIGVPFARAELNLLDSKWSYPGNGDYASLFRQMDVTAEVMKRLESVPGWLARAKADLTADMPAVTTGKHCNDPYDCPFQGFCEAQQPPAVANPIELLPGAVGKKLARKLGEMKGYVSMLDPSPEELTGTRADLYRRVQEAHRTGQGILADGSAQFMAQFPYPRYYFDFEGIDLPVPRWDGVHPYEQIPFQWSCHIERDKGIFDHDEFLDLSGNDPSIGCIERMRGIINPEDGGPIFVYFSPYERGRLQGLAQRHPQHAALMQRYIDRLADLLPIVKNYFYHPAMQGSFSIKKVLPAIALDLDYGELSEVQEGTGAQMAYLLAVLDPRTTPQRKAELDQRLRKYCRQDTWAMVEVAYFLARLERPRRPTGA